MVIAPGKDHHALSRLDQPADVGGGRCTWFLPNAEPLTARKRWIAGHVACAGSVSVDTGAVAALKKGGSLLPAGVTGVSGTFEHGDLILVNDASGHAVARGLTAYSAEDAKHIIGRHSRDFESILGFHGRDELIHRDDLVLE
jgi:glutamate 5-kinase